MPLFNANINLDQNQLQHPVIHSGSTKPDAAVGYTAVAGQIFYDTDTNQLQLYTGSSWEGIVTETVDSTTITDVTSILNTGLVVGRDSTDQIKFSTNDQIIFRVGNADGVIFKASGEIEATSLDISGDVDIAGALTLGTTLAVAEGGTGATSFADKSVIITQDSGTDTLAAVAMSTNGQLLIGGTSGPAVGVPTGGDGLTVTVGDGSLEYDLDADLTTVTSIYNAGLKVGRDAHNLIDFSTDNAITLRLSNADELTFDGTNFYPVTDTGMHLGKDGNAFKSLNLGDVDGDANGALIRFEKSRAGDTVTDNDDIGKFSFFAMNDAGTAEEIEYARWVVEAHDNADGHENARASFKFMGGGALNTALKFTGQADDTIDVEIAQGSGSTTTVAGNAVITGDLTVSGDTISANVGTLDVEDKNITLNKSAGDSSSTADGAGITIQDAVDASNDATILWTASSDTFTFSHNINATLATAAQGNITSLGTLTTLNVDNININGNAITSTNTNGDIDLTPNGTGEVNIAAGNLNYAGTAITTTGAELNLLDAGTSGSSVALATGDSLIIGDASASNASKKVLMSDVLALFSSNLTSVGALVEGSIAQGFGAIDNSGDGTNVAAGAATIKTDTLTATVAIIPDASDGATLGSASKEWSDLYLADGAQILFGDDQEIAITHVADKGLTLSHEADGAATPFILTLESEEDAVINGDLIAGIEFKASDASGTDAILPAAGIFAVATEEFTTSRNQAKLVFTTATSETAGSTSGSFDGMSEDMVLDESGNLTILGELDAATGDFSGAVDIAGDLTLSAGGDGALVFGNAGENSIKIPDNQASALIIEQANNAYMTFKTTNSSELVTVNKAFNVGSTFQLGGTSVTATAAEINLIDGGTSRTTNDPADGDGLLHNNNGTMEMTKVENVANYMTSKHVAAREKVFILDNGETDVSSSDNITYVVSHNFSSRNVMVEVYRNGSNSGNYQTVYVDVTRSADDDVTIVFGSARTAGDYTAILRKIG